MRERQVILAAAMLFAAACDVLAQAGHDPTASMWVLPPAENCNAPQPIFVEPPPMDCSTPAPYYVQPAPPANVVPLVPLPPSASPRPGALAGPTIVPPAPVAEASSPLANLAPGGAVSPQFGLPAGPDVPVGPNPVLVPATNDELAWETIAAVVSDYFPIVREQQARRSGSAWTEGRIETAYQSGATWFEPMRKNSVGAFNRWESTFQTIRRRATIRVMPDAGGFLVEAVVEKELEDLARPEQATAGAATFRTDGSLPSRRAGEVSRLLSSPRWIPLGRDTALETRLLADIQSRMTNPSPPAAQPVFP